MIESIRLHGFQKHNDLKLTFDPKITTIVGSSDVGKSSVIRALKWALRLGGATAPAPVNGDGEARVSVVIDGRTVTRVKGKDNLYKLDDAEFRAFRTTLPEPIENFLSLCDTNFQGQHDNSFWLSDSSGEVSRQLNQLVNLEIIDETLGRAGASVRTAKSLSVNAEELLKSSLVVYRKKASSRGLRKDFKKLEAAEDTKEAKEDLRTFLLKAIEDAANAEASVTKSKEVAGDSQVVQMAASLVGKAHSKKTLLEKVTSDATSAQKVIAEIGEPPSLDWFEEHLSKMAEMTKKAKSIRRELLEAGPRSQIIKQAKTVDVSGLDASVVVVQGKQKQVDALEFAVNAAKDATKKYEDLLQQLRPQQEELGKWKMCSECNRPL